MTGDWVRKSSRIASGSSPTTIAKELPSLGFAIARFTGHSNLCSLQSQHRQMLQQLVHL